MFWNKKKNLSAAGFERAEHCRLEAEALYRSGKYHCAEAVLEAIRQGREKSTRVRFPWQRDLQPICVEHEARLGKALVRARVKRIAEDGTALAQQDRVGPGVDERDVAGLGIVAAADPQPDEVARDEEGVAVQPAGGGVAQTRPGRAAPRQRPLIVFLAPEPAVADQPARTPNLTVPAWGSHPLNGDHGVKKTGSKS